MANAIESSRYFPSFVHHNIDIADSKEANEAIELLNCGCGVVAGDMFQISIPLTNLEVVDVAESP